MADMDDDRFNCSVCKKEYTITGPHVPRVLPCGHNLCETCVEVVTDPSGGGRIQCPQCRRMFPDQGLPPKDKYVLATLQIGEFYGEPFEMKATEEYFLRVAESLTSTHQLTDLALRLGFPVHTIDAKLTNQSSVTSAAYELLMDWRSTMPSDEEAMRVLLQVLANMNLNRVEEQIGFSSSASNVAPGVSSSDEGSQQASQEVHLLDVAECLTNRGQLERLGRRLGLSMNTIQSEIRSQPKTIRLAAYKLLMRWRRTISSDEEAQIVLQRELTNVAKEVVKNLNRGDLGSQSIPRIDVVMSKIAKSLTEPFHLQDLGFHLGLSGPITNMYTHSSNSIRDSAFQMLLRWKTGMASDEEALTELEKVQERLGLNQATQKFPGDVTSSSRDVLRSRDLRDIASGRTLSDKELLNVARCLEHRYQLEELGQKLGLSIHVLNSKIYEAKNNMTDAGFELLTHWRDTLSSPKEAWDLLGKALLHADLTTVASGVLGYPSNEVEEARKTIAGEKVLMEKYREVLKSGQEPSYRARINIIGHSGAGKTSLTRRVLGKSFIENLERTQGIETHRIELDLDEDGVWKDSNWEEVDLDPEDLERRSLVVAGSKLRQTKKKTEETKQKTTEVAPTAATAEVAEIAREAAAEAVAAPVSVGVEGGRTVASAELKPSKPKPLEPPPVPEDDLEELYKVMRASISTPKEQKGIVRIWDFGGQTEFYTTHHLFLDADAVNIIVMDVSKDLDEALERTDKVGVPNTQEELLCYWLRTIQSKAQEKNQKHLNITLVFTHKDKISEKQTDYANKLKTSILGIIEKNDLPSVALENIYIVDNMHGAEEDFRSLREKLFQMMKEQTVKLGNEERSWGAPRPIRWLKLEADMYKLLDEDEEPKKYLKLEELQKLSKAHQMNETELQMFLRFHHTMADLIHYQDEGLNHIVITDPQWLIDIFKILITPQMFIEKNWKKNVPELQQGRTNNKSLETLWKGHDVAFLIELMQKLDLMIEIGAAETKNKRFIVPSMLQHNTIHLLDTEPFKNLKLIYRAKHLAKFNELLYIGTFSRLLTECSKKWSIIEDEHLSYGYASFEVEKGIILALTLPHGSIVDVSIWCEPGDMTEKPGEALVTVQQIITRKLEVCKVPKCHRFEVLCPHWKPGEPHTTVTAELETDVDTGACHFHFSQTFCACHEAAGSIDRACKVCLTLFTPEARERHVLACRHALCTTCIRHLVSIGGDKIVCPECRCVYAVLRRSGGRYGTMRAQVFDQEWLENLDFEPDPPEEKQEEPTDFTKEEMHQVARRLQEFGDEYSDEIYDGRRIDVGDVMKRLNFSRTFTDAARRFLSRVTKETWTLAEAAYYTKDLWMQYWEDDSHSAEADFLVDKADLLLDKLSAVSIQEKNPPTQQKDTTSSDSQGTAQPADATPTQMAEIPSDDKDAEFHQADQEDAAQMVPDAKRRRRRVSRASVPSLLELALNKIAQETNSQLPPEVTQDAQVFSIAVSLGESLTLEIPNSDVTLRVPPGAPGFYMARRHTTFNVIHTILQHMSEAEAGECMVSPVVEAYHTTFGKNQPDSTPEEPCVLSIPHCIEDRDLLQHIRVRHHSLKNLAPESNQLVCVERADRSPQQGTFSVDQHAIRVYTGNFCFFTCSVCEKVCSKEMWAFVFAKLDPLPSENLTIVDIKVFLCNYLYKIEDFKKELDKDQAEDYYSRVAKRKIRLQCDPETTEVSLRVLPFNPDDSDVYWGPELEDHQWMEDTYFLEEALLSELLEFDTCHHCNCKPQYIEGEAMVVHACARGLHYHFRGRLEVDMHPAEHASRDGENGERKSSSRVPVIKIEFKIPKQLVRDSGDSETAEGASGPLPPKDPLSADVLRLPVQEFHEYFFPLVMDKTGARWPLIGPYLGMDSNYLERLAGDYPPGPHSTEKAARQMIVDWIKMGIRRTMLDLYIALLNAGEKQAAQFVLENAHKSRIKPNVQ